MKEDYNVAGIDLENIRNIYEIMVINGINRLMYEYEDFDHCRLCIEDVYALSLSRIPATYVQQGSIVLKKEMSQEDIDDVVRYSIAQVVSRPNHS